jgi:hypothetical protein
MLGHINQENDFQYHNNAASSQDNGLDAMIDKEFRLEKEKSVGRKVAKGAFLLGGSAMIVYNAIGCKVAGPQIDDVFGNVGFYNHNTLKQVGSATLMAQGENGSGSTYILASQAGGGYDHKILYVFNGSSGNLVGKSLTDGKVEVEFREGDNFIAVVADNTSGIDYTEAINKWNEGLMYGMNPLGKFENRDGKDYAIDANLAAEVVNNINRSSNFMKIGNGSNFTYGGGNADGNAGLHWSTRAEVNPIKAARNVGAVLLVEILELICSFDDYGTGKTDLLATGNSPTAYGKALLNFFGLKETTNIYQHMEKPNFIR